MTIPKVATTPVNAAESIIMDVVLLLLLIPDKWHDMTLTVNTVMEMICIYSFFSARHAPLFWYSCTNSEKMTAFKLIKATNSDFIYKLCAVAGGGVVDRC